MTYQWRLLTSLPPCSTLLVRYLGKKKNILLTFFSLLQSESKERIEQLQIAVEAFSKHCAVVSHQSLWQAMWTAVLNDPRCKYEELSFPLVSVLLLFISSSQFRLVGLLLVLVIKVAPLMQPSKRQCRKAPSIKFYARTLWRRVDCLRKTTLRCSVFF